MYQQDSRGQEGTVVIVLPTINCDTENLHLLTPASGGHTIGNQWRFKQESPYPPPVGDKKYKGIKGTFPVGEDKGQVILAK